MRWNSNRLHLGPVAVLFIVLALAAVAAAVPRAQAQGLPALCSSDFYVAAAPPTLTVTATPAIIDANSGTSTIIARPRNEPGINPQIPQPGCEVALSTDLGIFVSTGGPTAIALTDALGDATDIFRCDGVVGTATITALISLPLPNNIGPTLTATTQVECTEPALPDLSIEKSHAPDPLVFGGQGQFTLTITNNGPGTATLFTLVDFLHGGLTAVSASNGDWLCSLGGVVDCLYVGPPLGPGDMATVVITVTVGSAAELPEPFENCAQVATLGDDNAPVDDADPSNDEGCDLVTVVTEPGVPDLSIEKRHGRLDVFVQDDTGVDFIRLTCPGCVPTVFEAGIADGFALPSEPSSPNLALLQRMQSACPLGVLQEFDPVPDNRCFGHSFTGLPVIGAATLEFRLRAHPTDSLTRTDGLALQLSADGTTFAWSLRLSDLIAWATGGAQQQWTPGSDFTFVLDLAALPLDASGSTTTSILPTINNFSFGGQGQFALTVTNNGPGPASAFLVTDSLPPGFAFLSASDGDWTCTASGQDVTCVYGGPPLAPGESATVILTVAVGDPSDFTGGPVLHPVSIDVDNCATVAQRTAAGAAVADPNPDNDTGCDVIVMEGPPGVAGMITVRIPAGTRIVSFPVEVTSFDLIRQIPDLTVWHLCEDGMWEVDSARLPLSLRMDFVIPVGSGIIAITMTGGTVEV